MTMTPRRFYNPQFDLFLPNIVDLKFRDQKDTMERPFFSLSKSKRMKPIEYQNDNDGIFVTVQPHQDYGMATIWDADVLIWAASVLSDLKNRGVNEIPREIKFQPHDLLRVIGRATGGKDYSQLRGALDRLIHHHHHEHPGPARQQQAHHLQLDRPVGRPHRLTDQGEQGLKPHAFRLVLPRRDGGGGRPLHRPRLLLHQRRARALALPRRPQARRRQRRGGVRHLDADAI
jgi:plasmid replication initiation protein